MLAPGYHSMMLTALQYQLKDTGNTGTKTRATYLVGERAGHDKTGVASGTSQVQQTALSQHNDSMAIREDKPVTLRLDVLPLDSLPVHEASHVNFIVKVTNVANNGVVLHLGHVGGHDDVLVASGGHKDVTGVQAVIKG